ncbi:hypothetical protein [Halopseudomonas litoralis]|uniref:hypothetical protein n=1 Tax=Halopseudomonas litoralis TaxID=797277 RepID=UPI000B7EFE16|nr:hypothetical protein [Halopseudomonas litoralis]
MKHVQPEPLASGRDSSYGRLLRRLDQALDVARTRQWMAGREDVPAELEVCGLSKQDMQLLKQILGAMQRDGMPLGVTSLGRAAAPPSVFAARDCTQHQRSQY